MNKLCLVWQKKSFNIFDILFMKIEQNLTELWELEDKNTLNLKPEDPFNFSHCIGVPVRTLHVKGFTCMLNFDQNSS